MQSVHLPALNYTLTRCIISILMNMLFIEMHATFLLAGSVVLYMKWRGWSGGAKVLGKLPVLGRPTNLDYSRARVYCACSRCGWGLFGHCFSHLSLLFSFSLSLGDGLI